MGEIIDIYSDTFKETELYKLIKKNKEIISDDLKKQYENIECGDNFLNPYYPYRYNQIKDEIEQLIKDKRIYIYHCTKYTKKDIELLEDIRVLNFKEQKTKVISEIYDNLGISIVSKAENIDYMQMVREGQLWFVFDRDMIGCGYEGFFKYYGGEAIRRVIFNNDSEYLKYLEKIGIPIIIKCCIPINIIKSNSLVDGLINFISEKKNFLDAEGYIKRDIRKNEIQEIIYI